MHHSEHQAPYDPSTSRERVQTQKAIPSTEPGYPSTRVINTPPFKRNPHLRRQAQVSLPRKCDVSQNRQLESIDSVDRGGDSSRRHPLNTKLQCTFLSARHSKEKNKKMIYQCLMLKQWKGYMAQTLY